MGFWSNLFGGAKGSSCSICRIDVIGKESLIAPQSYDVQTGNSQQAHKTAENQGYICRNCKGVYCKTCLENRVSSPGAGAACPTCGGAFTYLP